MKHRIMIAAMLLVSLTAVQAQIDSIDYNVHFPYYYVGNSFDSIRSCTHDGVQCAPTYRTLFWNAVPDYNQSSKRIAWGIYPDSTIHIIGMAFGNSAFNVTQGSLYEYVFNEINNAPWYCIKCKMYTPVGNQLYILDSGVYTTNDLNPNTYRLYQFAYDYGNNVVQWNPYDYNHNIANYQSFLFEVYFENEIVVPDSVYVAFNIDFYDSSCLFMPSGFIEYHNPSSNSHIYPEINARVADTSATEDDPWTYLKTYAYPLIFPIIRRDCDTCPTVRGIEVIPSGDNRVFLRWQRGAGHLDWQLAYGPTGTAPENCTTLDFSSPISTILNLSPDTQYVAYLRARCRFARDEWGPWSDPVTLNTTEGIDEALLAGMITLSPNPATQTVTVESPLPMTLLEAYDEKGALMTSTATPTLDVSRWPTGVYLLRIYTPQGVATKKLTVAR